MSDFDCQIDTISIFYTIVLGTSHKYQCEKCVNIYLLSIYFILHGQKIFKNRTITLLTILVSLETANYLRLVYYFDVSHSKNKSMS